MHRDASPRATRTLLARSWLHKLRARHHSLDVWLETPYLWLCRIPRLLPTIKRRRTYSEFGEDRIVLGLLGRNPTSFLDIGAHDGISNSNTFLFAESGSAGVCVEPHPRSFSRLTALHHSNPRVQCWNGAISSHSGTASLVGSDFLASLVPDRSKYPISPREVTTVETLTFSEAALKLRITPRLEVLSVDVEGNELAVLQGVPFDYIRPKIVIVETHLLHPEDVWVHPDRAAIHSLLQSAGYVVAATTPANTMYMVRDRGEESANGRANGSTRSHEVAP